jgi:glycosyltransferase involved in cell wall biosynthesis
MKIAYVSYNLMHSIVNGGVGLKIRSAVRAWNETGHTAHWFTTTSAEVTGEEVTAFQFGEGMRGLMREFDRSRQLAHLIEAVAAYQPDVIYLRSGIYTYPLQRLFRIAPVVMELNTIDVVEYRMHGRFRNLVHRLTRNYVYGHAAAFVAVSYEIGGHPSNTKFGKPILVLANGIDLRRYEPLPAPNNAKPRLTYIGVPHNLWHGLDKLFWLAENCPDLEFDLIGSGSENFSEQFIPPNVQLHGFVDRSVYQEILAKADVGIGSLALHRIDINEGSPLKVREYLAYGLPIFLAYQDTDLIGTEFEFVLQIDNTEDNLRSNVAKIRQFAFDMQGKRVERQLIAPLIDTKYKEQQRLDFMKQFVVGM